MNARPARTRSTASYTSAPDAAASAEIDPAMATPAASPTTSGDADRSARGAPYAIAATTAKLVAATASCANVLTAAVPPRALRLLSVRSEPATLASELPVRGGSPARNRGAQGGGATSVPSRVLVIGLDAMEAPLVERGVESGLLPAFAALHDRAVRFDLTNPMRSHPGAIWPEINTGRSVGQVGLFFHPSQIRTGDPVPHKVATSEIDPRDDWWHVAGDAGRRICVLDVPHSVPRPGTNGIHVTDWGNHDRSWTPDSDPPSALAEVRTHIGDHPIDRCDEIVHG